MLTIGVLYGGRSGEHDVSLCSAASVVTALDRKKYNVLAIGIDRDGRWYVQPSPVVIEHKEFGKVMQLEKKGLWFVNHYQHDNKLHLHDVHAGTEVTVDVIFPVLHGTYCEDGTLQGLLELAMVPYVGADVCGSAVGMDKDVAKRLMRDGGVSVVPWICVGLREWERFSREIMKKVEREFGFPVFVKPARTGSSVGVAKVKRLPELFDCVNYAFKYDTKILIEKSVDAREIECAVLGNDDPVGSVLGEIVPRHEFYSYEAKYLDANGAELRIPADVTADQEERIRTMAVTAFKLLCCSGLARIDFFLDRRDDTIYCNEINTLPGFTSVSMYPKLLETSGVPYVRLLDRLIDLALDRHAMKMKVMTDWQA